jgi:hypothetical protein
MLLYGLHQSIQGLFCPFLEEQTSNLIVARNGELGARGRAEDASEAPIKHELTAFRAAGCALLVRASVKFSLERVL